MISISSQERAGSAPRPRLSPRPLEEIYKLPSHALLTPAETELVTRLTQSALAVRRSKGQWPPFIKFGRLVRYVHDVVRGGAARKGY